MSFNLASFLSSEKRTVILRGADKAAFIHEHQKDLTNCLLPRARRSFVSMMKNADYIKGVKADSRLAVTWYALKDS